MKAYEFNTNIKEGQITIPLDYLKEIENNQNLRVIILTEDIPNNNRDEIEYLINNPLKVEQVKPLTREEIYER
ncbi:MAG: hypothetical protein WBM32_24465 [Crocosphaera sp.]